MKELIKLRKEHNFNYIEILKTFVEMGFSSEEERAIEFVKKF